MNLEIAYRHIFELKQVASHPLTLVRFIGSSAAAHVGIECGVKGPTFATCGACSSAAHAIGLGRDYIRNGLVDVALVGASDAPHTYGMMRAWQEAQLLSPEGIFPFAKKRNGTVLGEGAGILVLESMHHAQGARRKGAGGAVRLRHDGGRHGHGQPRRCRCQRGHAAGARGCATCRDRHRLCECARYRHHDRRPQRDQSDQDGVRQARLQACGVLDQVHVWRCAGRERGYRGGRLHQGDGRGLDAADGGVG